MGAERVSQAGKTLLIGLGASLALAGCTTQSGQSGAATQVASAAQAHPGAILTGVQTGGMAAQYATPHPGAVAAAGASAWVPPAPAPAFALKEVPAAEPAAAPPGPAPAAPAAARPAVDASQLVRPEAAAPEPAASAPSAAPAALSAATRQEGRMLFTNYSCSSCHALADAGASGSIGPSLDGNRNLTRDYVIETVKTGRGPMPSFAGQLTDQQIATLADYVVGASRK